MPPLGNEPDSRPSPDPSRRGPPCPALSPSPSGNASRSCPGRGRRPPRSPRPCGSPSAPCAASSGSCRRAPPRPRDPATTAAAASPGPAPRPWTCAGSTPPGARPTSASSWPSSGPGPGPAPAPCSATSPAPACSRPRPGAAPAPARSAPGGRTRSGSWTPPSGCGCAAGNWSAGCGWWTSAPGRSCRRRFSPQGSWARVPVGQSQRFLRRAFARWGRPEQVRVDNGTPWGARGELPTGLVLWLAGLGVRAAADGQGLGGAVAVRQRGGVAAAVR
jgi:hypothetical protein